MVPFYCFTCYHFAVLEGKSFSSGIFDALQSLNHCAPMLLFYFLLSTWSLAESAEELSRASLIRINVFNYYCKTIDVNPFDPPCSLFDAVLAKCSRIQSSNDISIIFNGKIILNLIKDQRTIHDIGITLEANEIQIIEKPEFAALLETVADVDNIECIPWFNQKVQCLSDPSSKDCHKLQKTSGLERGLHYDFSGNLIAVDLSHLDLTGTVHLKSLPQSVKSLDLSFNNLRMLKFGGLEHKSLERLNVEHNDRLRIDTTCLRRLIHPNGPALSRILQLSSNQIFQSINDPKTKYSQIRQWLHRQQMFDVLLLDGVTFHRKDSVPFYDAMLNVIAGVTNKEVIPWYRHLVNETKIQPSEWQKLGIHRCGGKDFKKKEGKPVRYCSRVYTTWCSFNLSGLALEGHMDLGCLPQNVRQLDSSNNNLSSIAFLGDGPYQLKELNIQNNSRLRIDLREFNKSSVLLWRLNRLLISSNQLVYPESAESKPIKIMVQQWLGTTHLDEVLVDGNKIVRIQDPMCWS